MDVNKSNIRISSIKYVNDYLLDHDIKLNFHETIRISETLASYIESGLTADIERRMKSFDRYLKKLGGTSSGSLTVKK